MCVYVYVCVYIHTFKCGLPRGLSDIVSAYQCRDKGDTSWIPELGRSLGGGNGNLLQFSCLKNPMDRGAWRATVHGGCRRGGRDGSDFVHTHAREYAVVMQGAL